MSLLFYFLSPVQLRRGSDRVALVGTWHPARVNPLQLWSILWELLPMRPSQTITPRTLQLLEMSPNNTSTSEYMGNKWKNIFFNRHPLKTAQFFLRSIHLVTTIAMSCLQQLFNKSMEKYLQEIWSRILASYLFSFKQQVSLKLVYCDLITQACRAQRITICKHGF